jgi:LysM repeat protein
MSPMPQANPRGVLQYRVDSTDTLESIARTFTTTPDLIRELNGMSAGVKIKANDEIYVPAMGAVAP